MDGAERGKQFWQDAVGTFRLCICPIISFLLEVEYHKATAYRVEVLSDKGFLAIDGEKYPFSTFEVEVHHKLAAFMSPCGYYKAEFNVPPK